MAVQSGSGQLGCLATFSAAWGVCATVRESRAGDDFHLLWAARRSLQLLPPTADLRLVRLEGPNPADNANDSDFLGCDLIEYYGGSTLTDAHRIVCTQLKYSVKHASKAWTAARLAEAKGKQKVSVAKRLAEMFTGVCKKVGLEAALQKTTIALVSNQPVDSALADMLADAKTWLVPRPTGCATALLIKGLDVRHCEGMTKLLNATGLRVCCTSR